MLVGVDPGQFPLVHQQSGRLLQPAVDEDEGEPFYLLVVLFLKLIVQVSNELLKEFNEQLVRKFTL
jgi:hypothetical protein